MLPLSHHRRALFSHAVAGFACLLGSAVLVASCGRNPPALPALATDAVILAYGDSLTAGNGAQANESYPAVLERRIGRRVVNAGRSGEQSDAGLARLQVTLDEVRPQLVVLIHGGNDFLRKYPDAVPATNLRAMIAAIKQRGIATVLIGVPKPGLLLGTASFYEEIAREQDLHYDGATLKSILGDNALKSDLVHPNAAGYARLADAVEALLKRGRAL